MAQLETEVRLAGPRHARGSSARANARATLHRLAPVTVDRPIGGREGVVGAVYKPIKVVVRKLVHWYVEPGFADQRVVNDVLLKMIDDLYGEIERLEAEIRALEQQ
jgi:hypothetical protein